MIKEIKKNLHILQKNKELRSQQFQDEFALIPKLLHILDLTFIQIQYIYSDKFTHLELLRNTLWSLTGTNAELVCIWTGITCIQGDADEIYMHLEMLANHTISPCYSCFHLQGSVGKYQKGCKPMSSVIPTQ